MSKFLSKRLSSLIPYVPGEQPKDNKYIKLNTNESPFPPSSVAVSCAKKVLGKLNLYPDPTCSELISKMAINFGVSEREIILGNGSDEILNYIFLAYCDKDCGAKFPDITYGFYSVQADLCGVPYKKIPLNDDFKIDVNDYIGADCTIFIANPNAPTGIELPLEEIEKIVLGNPNNIVVIDEAYVDFGGTSALPLIKKYDNVIVVQTFSKSRSMAGARLGMAFANEKLIQDLNSIKYSINPYNVNKTTMALGVGVMLDEKYTKKNCEQIIKNREWTILELEKLGFTCTNSKSNFIFARHEKMGGKEIYKKLKEKNILVRHFDTDRICEYNRITVGTKLEMKSLIDALKEILKVG